MQFVQWFWRNLDILSQVWLKMALRVVLKKKLKMLQV